MKLIPNGHKCKTCGKTHTKIPNAFKPWIDGNGCLMAYDFKCDCGSNMFVKQEKVKAA